MGISPSGIVNLPTEKALKMWHPGIEEHVAALDPHFADYCYTRGCCVIRDRCVILIPILIYKSI